jgi:hypothetical protein
MCLLGFRPSAENKLILATVALCMWITFGITFRRILPWVEAPGVVRSGPAVPHLAVAERKQLLKISGLPCRAKASSSEFLGLALH